MKILVLEYKVVDYKYFMDEMQDYELQFLLENCCLSEKGSWERLRLNMWTTAQVNSTKKIDMKELMEFPWETATKRKPQPRVSYEESERQRKEFLKMIKR